MRKKSPEKQGNKPAHVQKVDVRETRLRKLETKAKAAKPEAKVDESPVKLGLVEVPSSIHNSKSKAEAKKHP